MDSTPNPWLLIIWCLQASGEAEFTTDIPTVPNELAAAFVLTTKVWR